MTNDRDAVGQGVPKFGWGFFGSELKLRREQAGLTQQELGNRVFRSASYIGQFEVAIRKPQLDLAERIDEVLETGGLFGRLCKDLINRSPFADWFADAADLQKLAATISVYCPSLVHGLLQVEEYAREVFRAAQPPDAAPFYPTL